MASHWRVWLLATLVLAVPLAVTPAVATQTTEAGTASPGAANATPAANATASVTTDPGGTVTADRWETVRVTVRADATGVAGYQSALSYDPAVLQVQTVSGTDDFGAPVATVDNTNGTVVFNGVRPNGTANPALAQLSVQLIGTGGQRGTLSVVDGETRFSDATGATFGPEGTTGVTFEVRPGSGGTDRVGDPDRSGLGVGGPAALLAAAVCVGWLVLRNRRQ